MNLTHTSYGAAEREILKAGGIARKISLPSYTTTLRSGEVRTISPVAHVFDMPAGAVVTITGASTTGLTGLNRSKFIIEAAAL